MEPHASPARSRPCRPPRCHRYGAAAALVAWLTSAVPAQSSDELRDELLGTGIELSVVTAGLDKHPTPKSLTEQTPAWLRIVLRQSFAAESAPALVNQLTGLLGVFRSSSQPFDPATSTITGPEIARIASLEGKWLTAAPESLRLDDLMALDRTYAALAHLEEPLRLLSSTVPWEPLLAMLLAQKYRLDEARREELFAYVKRLPRMALRLQVATAKAILHRSEDPEQIAEVLAHLSSIYGMDGKLQPSVMLYRESMRLSKAIKGWQWCELADLYARNLHPALARRALAVAREMVDDAGPSPKQKFDATSRADRIAARIELADRRRSLGAQPSTAQRIEAMALDRRLGRVPEASQGARELSEASVKDARIFANLGMLCIRGGLREKAVTCFKMAQQLPNQDAAYHELGGWLMLRPLIEEGFLLGQGRGDVERTLQRCSVLRAHVDALVAQPGYRELRTASVLLGLLDDLKPAIRAKDAGQALAILRTHTEQMLGLRSAAIGTVAPNQLALFALAIMRDRQAMHRVLAQPTPLETRHESLLPLRAALAFLLLHDDSDAGQHDLVRATLTGLPKGWPWRDILLGTQAAVRAHTLGETGQWKVAEQHFAAALASDRLSPLMRASTLNNLGICQQRSGRLDAARQSLQSAITTSPDTQSPARLNLLTLSDTPDPAALARLDEQCADKDWSTLRTATRRWLIAAALSRGDQARARALAAAEVGLPHNPLQSQVGVLAQFGQVHWGVGVAKATGFRLQLRIDIQPWLIRTPPLSGAQVEALAR